MDCLAQDSPSWRLSVYRIAPFIIAILAGIGVFSGPLAFGGTTVWGRCGLEILAGLMGLVWILSCTTRSLPFFLLLGSLAVLGMIQLVPLPATMLGVVSPFSERCHASLTLFGVKSPLRNITVCPASSLFSLRQILMALLVIAAVAEAVRDRARFRALACVIAFTGLIVLALGGVFAKSAPYRILGFYDMTGPIRPWKSPLIDPLHSAGMGYPDVVHVGNVRYTSDAPVVGDVFGPYVSSNHFAGCVELTLPMMVALALMFARRSPSKQKLALGYITLYVLGAVLLVTFGAKARAGTLGLAGGLLVFAAVVTPVRKFRVLMVVSFILLIAVSLASFWVVASRYNSKVASGVNAKVGGGNGPPPFSSSAARRMEAGRIALRMARRSPIFGIGLGTYGKAYPFFAEVPPVFYFCHNDYLQFFAETGFFGAAVGLCVAAWLLQRIVRQVRREKERDFRFLKAGALGALAAIGFHSIFDYNLQIPANLFIVSVVLGLALATHRKPDSARCGAASFWSRAGLGFARLVVAIVVACLVWVAAKELASEGDIMPLRRALAAQSRDGRKSNEQEVRLLMDALPKAERAAEMNPSNAKYAELVAQAYLHLSKGRASLEIERSATWFRRSLRLCPINGFLRNTLLEIQRESSPDTITTGISDIRG